MFQMQEISVACKSAGHKWELHSQDTGPPWQGRVAAAACLGDPTGSARTVLTTAILTALLRFSEAASFLISDEKNALGVLWCR